MPAHLVLLQLIQDVGRHSIPDSHHLWKARERGVRLQASRIIASGMPLAQGRDTWRSPDTALVLGVGASVSQCQPYSALGQGWVQNGEARRAQDQSSGHLTLRKGRHPRAQVVIHQRGGTRGSWGKEQKFSQRRLGQAQGLVYCTAISSWLMRAVWQL